MIQVIKIIPSHEHQPCEPPSGLNLSNDADPLSLDLQGVQRIDLHFPAFTDGRAFSQARLLRQRLGFRGEIRATGDVGLDQLLQMQRCGFDAAVLPEGANLQDAQRQIARFADFYQGDALRAQPRFARQGG